MKGLCYDDLDAIVPCDSISEKDCLMKEFWHKDWSTCEYGSKCREIIPKNSIDSQAKKE